MRKKRKILVIDDNKNNFEAYKSFFELEKFEMYFADNGEKGLLATRKIMPDIILLDLMMPVMNGYEFLEIIRSESIFDDIPVLVVTTKNGSEGAVKVFNLGANDYLRKPFDIEELISRTNNLITVKQSRASLKEENNYQRKYQRFLEEEIKKWAYKAVHYEKAFKIYRNKQ